MPSTTATPELSKTLGRENWLRTSRGAPTTRPAPPTASMSRESFRMVSTRLSLNEASLFVILAMIIANYA